MRTPETQGTRVASPVIGTQNGPKIPPTATQFGGTEEVSNTQSTVTQLRGWPLRKIRDIISRAGSREMVLTTSAELHTGPAPGRVLRQLSECMNGYIGPDLAASFPYNAEWSVIPHQFIPRRAIGTGPYRRNADDVTQIPATYAGNPRVGG